MSFKRQKTKYNHFFYQDMILIGLSKEIDEKEAELYKNAFICLYDKNIYTEMLKLGQRDRIIISEALEKWSERKNKEKKIIIGKNWDIVLDFILYVYDETSLNVAERISETLWFKKQSIDKKTIFNKNIKGRYQHTGCFDSHI